MIHCLTYLHFQGLIQLKDFPGGIHHCVTGVGKWIFDTNFLFELPLKQYDLDFCFINYS